MRDIQDYEEKYKTEPCEIYQVRYRRKKIIELLEVVEPKNILEIGCGLEPLFEHYTSFDNMVIVEPGQSFVKNALKMAKKMDKNIVCIQGFFEKSLSVIKKENIKFDYIVLSSLLHEVEKPKLLLESIAQVCEEDTIVHINVPNANSIHRLLAKEMGLIKDVYELSDLQKTMQRNRVYDLDSLCAFVEECGFNVLERGTYFPKLLSANQMEQMLEQKIISEDIFEGLDRLIKYIPDLGSEIYVQVQKN